MGLAKSFIAGFLSTLIFHQGLLALFHLAGLVPRMPWNLTPVPPLGMPSVISLAFWGGVWGVGLWLLLRDVARSRYWRNWVLFGAIGPTAVALFIVFPLKGLAFAGGWDPKLIIGALLVNAAWGFGCALLLKLMGGKAGRAVR
jgi:hypothetical protein